MSGRPPVALRVAARCGWGLLIGVLIAAGILWHEDRRRAWERPRWDPGGFAVPGGRDTSRSASAAACPGDSEAARTPGPGPAPRLRHLQPQRLCTAAERRGAATDTAETWVVAFHPLCRHCAESLERTTRRAAAEPGRPHVVLLVIDAGRVLAESAASRHATLPVWWDARQVWRRRWGHRVYGEVLRFGPDGAYRGLLRPAGVER